METHYLSAALEHQHFTYGWLNPAMGLAFAAAGSFLGLSAARYARTATTTGGRVRWILLSSLAIGGIGIWMMHFIAMIGFTVVGSRIAYDVKLTAASFALAVLAVGFGVAVTGTGRAGWPRLALGGLVCGAGVVGMHYTGMAAIATDGTIAYDSGLVAASVAIAVVASTVALRFAAVVDRRGTMAAASAVMSVAVVGMHYTGMAAMSVSGESGRPVAGMDPLVLMLPILLLATVAIIGLVFGVLNAPSREDTGPAAEPTVRLADATRL